MERRKSRDSLTQVGSTNPTIRSGRVAQQSKIPRPSGGSQEYLRREYHPHNHRRVSSAISFPNLGGIERTWRPDIVRRDTNSNENSLGGNKHTRRHSIAYRDANSNANSPPGAETAASGPEFSAQPTPSSPINSPRHTVLSRRSSSALPRMSNISDTSTYDAVFTSPSEEDFALHFSLANLSSTAMISDWSVNKTAVPPEQQNDVDVASFSTRHSQRQVQVQHDRQGPHEWPESPHGGTREDIGRSQVDDGAGEEVMPVSTPVRSRSQGKMNRSPPPSRTPLTAKILRFFPCGRRA